MKLRKLGLVILSALTFSIAACDNNPVDSGTNPSGDNSSTTYVSPWGEKLYSLIYEHYGMDIPFATGAKGAKFGVMEDDYGDPMIVILCDYDQDADAIDSAIEAYADSAVKAGYNVTAADYDNGHPAYDCSIPYNSCMTLHIQCLYGGMDTDGDGEAEDYLGLFLTSDVTIDPYVWPEDLIDYVLGFKANVPALTGDGITYSSSEIHDDDFGNYVSIVVYGVDTNSFETYKNLLEANSYTVEFVQDTDYDYYLAWLNDTFYIQLYFGNDGTRDYIDINVAKGDVHDYFDI